MLRHLHTNDTQDFNDAIHSPVLEEDEEEDSKILFENMRFQLFPEKKKFMTYINTKLSR